ncbi:MAG: DUF3570 domain-containing protein [Verrucomicrobia bacterium]|nr:DUF3570 domain-containing protein [Verrucomicrobiota bacterium]
MINHFKLVRGSRALRTAVVGLLLRWLAPGRAQADDSAAIKYEHYGEEGGRIAVSTISGSLEKTFSSFLTLRASMVYDAISGATPTGGPPPAGSTQVPLAQLTDTRRAVNLELTTKLGRYTVTPQVSHSVESDYESWGIALNQSFEFNDKNTTLTAGVSHDFDTVLTSGRRKRRVYADKDTTDVLIGVTQLLSPKTVLTVNLTIGSSHGFLNDPYKGFNFSGYDPDAVFPEKRPGHKIREVGYVSLTQFITAANASVETSYRFHHDSFGITAHTAGVAWFQKIGGHLIVSPSVRYYRQSAADFYFVSFPGDPTLDPPENFPQFYSADFRLSQLESWTAGVTAHFKVDEHFSFDLGYKYYAMFGLDGVTSASAYPKAHVYTIGATLWF